MFPVLNIKPTMFLYYILLIMERLFLLTLLLLWLPNKLITTLVVPSIQQNMIPIPSTHPSMIPLPPTHPSMFSVLNINPTMFLYYILLIMELLFLLTLLLLWLPNKLIKTLVVPFIQQNMIPMPSKHPTMFKFPNINLSTILLLLLLQRELIKMLVGPSIHSAMFPPSTINPSPFLLCILFPTTDPFSLLPSRLTTMLAELSITLLL